MSNIVAIAIGGAFGAVGRYATSLWIYQLLGRSFPFGTLTVNFVGSFAMGFLSILLIDRLSVGPELRAFLLIGFLGSYTTFSTFSIETINLMSNGEMLKAVMNMIMSVLICVVACWLGILLGRQI